MRKKCPGCRLKGSALWTLMVGAKKQKSLTTCHKSNQPITATVRFIETAEVTIQIF